MAKLKLIIEYEGTRYRGFQIQAEVPTIQGEVELALFRLTGERIRVAGASRTDSGVHAQGQVVGFKTGSTLPLETFIKGLNHYLPEDIAVMSACYIDDDFDVRRDALSREYRYTILNSRMPSPIHRRHACLITAPLNVEAMSKACWVLIGRHDFASFAGTPRGSTVRTVYKAEIHKAGQMTFFDMVADSFLPQQVRRTVGALVNVGIGKANVELFWEMARLKRSGLARLVAPAHGLCLMKVNYREQLSG